MEKILDKIKNYFDCKVIGSYLFVQAGYLDETEVNDIDIMVTNQGTVLKVKKLLEDEGFKEGKGSINRETEINKYGQLKRGTLKFTSEKHTLAIHIMMPEPDIPDSHKILSLEEIIAMKWKNRSKTDLRQLALILSKTEAKDEE